MTFFSEIGWPQEIAALVLSAVAALYVLHKLTGWPRRPRRATPSETPDRVLLGGRLEQGLRKAEKSRRDGDESVD